MSKIYGVLVLCGILLVSCNDSVDANDVDSSSSSQIVESSSSSSQVVESSSSVLTEEYLANLGPSPYVLEPVDCTALGMIDGTLKTNNPLVSLDKSFGVIDSENGWEINLSVSTFSYFDVSERQNDREFYLKYKQYDTVNHVYAADSVIGDMSVSAYFSPDSAYYSRISPDDTLEYIITKKGMYTTCYANGKKILETYNQNGSDFYENDTLSTIFYSGETIRTYTRIHVGYRDYYLQDGSLLGVLGYIHPYPNYECVVD